MRNAPFWTMGLLVTSLMVAAGCRSPEPAEIPEQPESPAEETKAEAPEDLLAVDIEVPSGGDASKKSASGESDPACVGPIEEATPESREIDGWSVEANGYRVTFEREGEDAEGLTLGVIADIKEDTGENMFNLGRYIEWWRSEDVDAVVVPGDAGETVSGLARALNTLAEPGWPVMVLPGNREAREVYRQGVDQAKAESPNILDLSQRRLIELPGASLVSLPGYHDPRFLHERTGCQYFREDVEALVPVARDAEDPVVLVAHSGPRGDTPRAIDYAREAGNVGDGNINRLIAAADIPFGIFAHIHEAGGQATDVLGRNLIPQGELVDSFFMNVGPADSIPWAMNDETQSNGMAGLVRFQDGKASYEINRLEALDEEQRALAGRLASARDEADDE